MNKTTTGIIISINRQWWLKINTKHVRIHPLDGAVFPHIIKVKYTVNGREYTKRKWIGAKEKLPALQSTVTVIYCEEKPSRAKIQIRNTI